MTKRASIKNFSVLTGLIVVASLLNGCVTTVEGGFSDQASPEQALEDRVSLARQYIADGNWGNAKRNLDLANEIDPNSAIVDEAFGLLYQRTGEIELAQEHFEEAIRHDKSCSRCRNNYAAFLYTQEKYKEAEKQLSIVVRDTLYSARPQAFVNLGLCRVKLFDSQGAEEAFVRALSMERTNSIALLELATLRYEAGDYLDANKHYNTYRSVVRQQSARGLWLGVRLAQAEGNKDAEASFALALSNRFPNSPEYAAYKRMVSGE